MKTGDWYDGEWKDDKANGKGRYRSPRGTLDDGNWKDDL